MGVSATDPIGQALGRTGRMLFKPFDFTKWLVLGFAAFLAYLAEGWQGNFNNVGVPGPGPAPGRTVPELLDELKRLFLVNAHWVLPVAAALLAVWVALVWVRARGKFVFLDGVARNDASIAEPWKRFRAEANSFFLFDVALSLGMTLGVVATGAIAYAIALPDLRANTVGSAGATAIAVGASLFVGLVVMYALAVWVAEDFLIPLMYLRSQPIGAAWAEFQSRILAGHVGVIALYGLMRILLGLAAAAIVMAGTCVTCCVAGIPYVSSVVFLPVLVFGRTYPLCFLAQFGGDYNTLSEVQPQRIIAFPVILHQPPPVPIEPLPPEALEPPPPPPPPPNTTA